MTQEQFFLVSYDGVWDNIDLKMKTYVRSKKQKPSIQYGTVWSLIPERGTKNGAKGGIEKQTWVYQPKTRKVGIDKQTQVCQLKTIKLRIEEQTQLRQLKTRKDGIEKQAQLRQLKTRKVWIEKQT